MKIFSILLCVGLTLASISHSDHESYRQRIPHAKSTNTTTKQPNFTLPQLLALQKKFLDAFMYPANVEQAKAINSTLVAEDVRGRVDITRTFVGRELNTEYLFGLFANLATSPGQISLLGVPLSYEILHFTGNQNIATVSTKIMFNFTSVNLVLPLRIDIWNTFNAAGQITQYDSSFIFWDWAVTTLLQAAAPIF